MSDLNELPRSNLSKSNITRRNEGTLFWLGALSALVYVVTFIAPYYLGKHFDSPKQELGIITGYSPIAAFLFVSSLLLLFLVYYAAIRTSRQTSGAKALLLVLGNSTLFSLLLIFCHPITSGDIYAYISYGQVQTLYGLNPAISPPNSIPAYPFLDFLSWPGESSTYGPVWNMISAGLVALGGNDLWLTLLLFKSTAVLFLLSSSCLIFLILRRISPDYALSGTTLFAWNPLVLLETAANGHNDAVMVFFLLGAFFLIARESLVRGMLLLTLSALVKFATAPLLPLLLVFGIRRNLPLKDRFFLLSIGVIASAVVTVILYLPYWHGLQSIGLLKRNDYVISSFAAIGVFPLTHLVGAQTAKTIMGSLALGLFALIFLFLLLRLRYHFETYLRIAYETFFYCLVVATVWFVPWYVTTLVAIGALIDDRGIRRRTILFSLSAEMSHIVWQFFLQWYPGWMPQTLSSLLAVIIIFTLPLSYTLYEAIKNRKRNTTNVRPEISIGGA